MTTSAVIPQITFAGSSGSGTLGPFSLIKSGTPIHFTANSQIKVYRYDTTTDSAPTLLVEGTDYDLTGGPNAGSLTLTSPQTGLLTAERLFVYREQPTTQTLDLITGGNFSAANLEARLDRTTEMIQELRREVQSTVRFSLFDTDAIPGTLPLGAAIDKLVYVSGTASAPTLATINNPADLLENITLAAENITNINLVGSDLGGADTIGIVAADLDGDNTIGTVATDIANVNAVATWIGGGGIGAASVTATGSTTARTLAVRFAEVCNVRDYGATGDGSTDDTTAIQAAITAANATTHKRLYFPAGTYDFNAQLLIHSGCTWFGDGKYKSTIRLNASAGNIIPFRTNTTSGTKNVFDQANIAFYDLAFEGFDDVLTATASETHAPLMRLWKIDGLTIERCKFSAHRYIMLSLGGVKNFSITNCEFEDWGRTDDLASSGTLPVNEAGAAIWCAANPIDDTPTTHGTMRGNYFHDAQWSCVYLLGQNLDFSFNRMENTMEGNYARCTDVGADSESRNITYIGNHHQGVTKRLIAAAGFECGAKGVIIANNTFIECVASAIDLTDTCEDAVVTGNLCIDCNTSSDFSNYASITPRVTSTTGDALNGITISNNTVRSSAGYYGIRLYRVSGSDTFSNIHVYGNDLVGSASSSNNYLTYDASQFGTNVSLHNNQGVSDYAPSVSWSPTVSTTGGDMASVSTTARYFTDGATVHFTVIITGTDITGGSGSLTFTLPATPAYAGACVGKNTGNGKAVVGIWGTATSTVTVNYYDATFPLSANGQILRITGAYMQS